MADTPKHVDLLMGCDILDFLGATVDRKSQRAVFAAVNTAVKIAIPIDSTASNLQRVTSAPLNVLTTCSGCNYF